LGRPRRGFPGGGKKIKRKNKGRGPRRARPLHGRCGHAGHAATIGSGGSSSSSRPVRKRAAREKMGRSRGSPAGNGGRRRGSGGAVAGRGRPAARLAALGYVPRVRSSSFRRLLLAAPPGKTTTAAAPANLDSAGEGFRTRRRECASNKGEGGGNGAGASGALPPPPRGDHGRDACVGEQQQG
jgi:hypothetical protein